MTNNRTHWAAPTSASASRLERRQAACVTVVQILWPSPSSTVLSMDFLPQPLATAGSVFRTVLAADEQSATRTACPIVDNANTHSNFRENRIYAIPCAHGTPSIILDLHRIFLQPWASIESMDFHGCHGIAWSQWNSKEFIEFHVCGVNISAPRGHEGFLRFAAAMWFPQKNCAS